jgi:hypothetical protein
MLISTASARVAAIAILALASMPSAAQAIIVTSCSLTGPTSLNADGTMGTYTVCVKGSGTGSLNFAVYSEDIVDDQLQNETSITIALVDLDEDGNFDECFNFNLWCNEDGYVTGSAGSSENKPAVAYVLIEHLFGTDACTTNTLSITCDECTLVVGNSMSHAFTTQVGDVGHNEGVMLDDVAEFVLPMLPSASAVAGLLPGGSTRVQTTGSFLTDRWFTVQVVMWNPDIFPNQPEQFTNGLLVHISPDGTVQTKSYGSGTGMLVWAETGVNAAGQPVVRFPFSIPGM